MLNSTHSFNGQSFANVRMYLASLWVVYWNHWILCVWCISKEGTSVRKMATLELIKKDYMMKRSQMKSRIKSENYRHRWFELLPLVLRYSDGSPDVRIFSFTASWFSSWPTISKPLLSVMCSSPVVDIGYKTDFLTVFTVIFFTALMLLVE